MTDHVHGEWDAGGYCNKLVVRDGYGDTCGYKRRPARLPRWGGRHGDRVKGSVKWVPDGYQVVYSFLLGYETTLRESETYSLWFLAIGQYREHDRYVRERQKLEEFRAAERVL